MDDLNIKDTKEYKELADELYILKSIYDSAVDQGIMACDKNRKIILYNLPSSVYDELIVEQVLGRQFEEIFPDTENSALLHVLKTGEVVLNRDVTYVTRGGKKIHQLSSAYPIMRDEELIGAFAITRFHEGIRQLLMKSIELQKQLMETKKACGGAAYTFENIIGNSEKLKSAVRMAKKAALSSSPVLIYGETGTGKELFVQSIHNAGVYKDSPFIAINCAAIPDTLLESTLFGTKKGAFTGAGDTPGIFEQAQNGTLFLDELNSMPVYLQTKLLRVIQEKTVRRLGGTVDTPVQCRIIASCNQPPLECIKKKTLRDDLYFRVSVICIDIPPLRERKEDIILLAEYFIRKFAGIYGMPKIKMSEEFAEALFFHLLPGTVMELEQVIESSLVMVVPGEDKEVCHLKPYIRERYMDRHKKNQIAYEEGGLKEFLIETEREALLDALARTDWNISKTAKLIGYTRSNLQYRMQKLGIESFDKESK